MGGKMGGNWEGKWEVKIKGKLGGKMEGKMGRVESRSVLCALGGSGPGFLMSCPRKIVHK